MIRPAGPEDLPAVLEVFLASALLDAEYLPPWDRTVEALHRWFTKKRLDAQWVAEVEGEVVAVVGATRRPPTVEKSFPAHAVELCRLAVAPGFRRRGIAADLTEVVARFADGIGSQAVWLRCVDDSAAHRYYLARGWQFLGHEGFGEPGNDQLGTILGAETTQLLGRRVT